jgi:4-diphosphocytidyl-2-C-methyl-D-erythritol kinase
MPGVFKASAKINLFLHVGDKRGDGFHPLQSLAVFTDAGDTVSASESAALTLRIHGRFAAGLNSEADNLVLRAAHALAKQSGRVANAALVLTKNLPIASGIGGGSADAAATLRALHHLWELDLDDAALENIGASLGSDIPVCVTSHAAFMEGRGEILRRVKSFPRIAMLLVNPGVAVPTKDVFAALQMRSGVDKALPLGRFRDCADLLRFLETTQNDLEAPARALQPVIGTVLDELAALPGALFVRMSGSGATCFAIFPDDESCARAGTLLAQEQPNWWTAPTFVAEVGMDHDEVGLDIGPTDQGL